MSSLYQRAILPDAAATDDKTHDGVPTTSTITTTHVRLTSARPFTPDFVQGQLSLPTNSKPKSKSKARALYDERVRRRQLVLAPKPRPPANEDRRRRRQRRRRRGADDDARMGRREAAEKGLWRLRDAEARWELFVPLHRLWLGYMSELLGLSAAGAAPPPGLKAAAAAAGMHAKLVKADFHGSIVTVRRSRNAALVGASGIVVQETENTFKIVTRKDKLKVIPKQGSVFVFAVPLYHTGTENPPGQHSGDDRPVLQTTVLDGAHVEFELYGNQFCFRAADRAGRKFKHKESIEL